MQTRVRWLLGLLLAALMTVCPGNAEDMATVERLAPMQAVPSDVLCSHPVVGGGPQYIACDAFKEFGEPVSPVVHPGKTQLAIRVAYIPSFSPWSTIRVEFVPSVDGSGVLVPNTSVATATVSTTLERDRRYSKTFELTWDETYLLLKSIDLTAAFTLPNADESKTHTCMDGTDYVVEFAEGSRYHWLYLGCDDDDNPRTSLHPMVDLLGIIARAHDSEGLKDFPGH